MAKEPKKLYWEELIEDDDWLNEYDEALDEGDKKPEVWKPWSESDSSQPIKNQLAEREALIKAERQAEAELLHKARESRDSFLRQIDKCERPEQIGWVTKRFQKWVTVSEATLEKMLHLRSNMQEVLSRACDMYYNALELARRRVKGAKNLDELERDHRESIRKIHKDTNDYIR